MPNSLSRKDNHRKSLLRNLATSLILYEEIKTTMAKAKAVKPIVEHLIIIAKKNNLNSRRRLLAYLFDKKAVAKVFEILVPRYKNIKSGHILVFKIGPRLGDNASMVILKLKEGSLAGEAEEKIIEEKNASKRESKVTKTGRKETVEKRKTPRETAGKAGKKAG